MSLYCENLDFSSLKIEEFSENDFLEILRVFRHLTSKIDDQILSILGKEAVLTFEIAKFAKAFPDKIHNRSRDRLETMFLDFVQREFGLERKDVDLSRVVF
jgi:hypothetical protein